MSSLVPGQTVEVHPVIDGVAQPIITGTVVTYFRNGYWTIREAAYGTTCAYQRQDILTTTP